LVEHDAAATWARLAPSGSDHSQATRDHGGSERHDQPNARLRDTAHARHRNTVSAPNHAPAVPASAGTPAAATRISSLLRFEDRVGRKRHDLAVHAARRGKPDLSTTRNKLDQRRPSNVLPLSRERRSFTHRISP